MKRFIFDNLVYRIDDDQIMLINLTSYRRMILGREEVEALCVIDDKLTQKLGLTEEEQQKYDRLLEQKQIMGDELDRQVFDILSKEAEIKLEKYPVRSITFNVTHKCNFGCFYCYQNAYKHGGAYASHMTPEDVDAIMEYIKLPFFETFEQEEVVISGGEPLLAENIPTIRHILDTVPAKKFIMFSNGANIIRYSNEIDLGRIDEFQISLDGTADVVRTVNKYQGPIDDIIAGVSYLLDLHRKVDMVVMWTKELEKELDSFIELIEGTGFLESPLFTIKLIVARDYYDYNKLDTRNYDLSYIQSCMSRYNDRLKRLKCSLELFSEVSFLKSVVHRPIDEMKTPRYKRCDITSSVPMVFEPNGEVHWCICLDKRNGMIGDYRKQLVNTERLDQYGNRSVFAIPKCRSCRLKYVCSAGCVLGVPDVAGDLNTPVCSIFEDAYFWDNLESFI